MNCTSIVGNWYVSNAAMTLATVLATIPVFFFWRHAHARRTITFFHGAGNVQMYRDVQII